MEYKKFNYFKIMNKKTGNLEPFIFTTIKKAEKFIKKTNYIIVKCNWLSYTQPYLINPKNNTKQEQKFYKLFYK
ncbi:MAG: hypothetical protein PWQ43_737 [Rikenellaceae bacterium]|nr:hypothetical protein [Rikenellaceae bacterium]